MVDSELIEAAIAALRPDREVLRAAVAALRPDPKVLHAAVAALRPDPKVLHAAVAALGPDPKVLYAAIAALRPDPKVPEAALRPDPDLLTAAFAATRSNLESIKAAVASTRPDVDLLDSLAVSTASLRHLTRASTEEIGADTDAGELLEELGEVLDEDDATPESMIDWLVRLPPISQRRALLLGIGALWAIVDAVDAVAGITQPDHLDKVILALLAMASFLSEWIELQQRHGD